MRGVARAVCYGPFASGQPGAGAMQPWHMWAIVAMILMLMELMGAHFILLGLGLAAVVMAVVMMIWPGLGFADQILIFTASAAVIVPAIIVVFRRYYPEGGVSVINEPGSKAAGPHVVVERNGRIGVEIYGDFYPARFSTGLEPEPGEQVVVTEFKGIVALVRVVSEDNSQGES